jgi:hypothetical protein
MARSLERSPESKGKDIVTPQSYLVFEIKPLLLKKIREGKAPKVPIFVGTTKTNTI